MINLIWIKRVSQEEDEWLKTNLAEIDSRFNVIVVGHTNLDYKKYNFKYVPFWDHGLDRLGLLCHKKNLGIKYSEDGYCLVLHADVSPDKNFYDIAINKKYDHNTAVCPISFYNGDRALSWCNYVEGLYTIGKIKDRSKSITEPADEWTYISGGCIFGTKKFFLKFPWNEYLRHNQGEDVELSRRIFKNGGKLIAESELICYAKRSQ
jgi:hypothetical protein